MLHQGRLLYENRHGRPGMPPHAPPRPRLEDRHDTVRQRAGHGQAARHVGVTILNITHACISQP